MTKKRQFLTSLFTLKKLALLLIAFSIGVTYLSAQNYALKFSANSNQVTFSKPNYTGTNWTVEFWAKRTLATNHATFLAGSGVKLNLETYSGTHKVGYSKDGDKTFDYTLPLNTWAHVAYVYNNGSLSLFVNGVQAGAAQTVTMAMPLNSIGLASESFVGEVDEIRIWKTSRTGTEITGNMNKSVNPVTESNLLAYWYFDDQATTVTDLSSAGVVGTIKDATYVLNNNSSFATTLPQMELLKVSASHENEFYVIPGSLDQELLCIKVQTQGVQNPMKLTEINITTEGTSDITDIENVSVYYTKNSDIFATTESVQAKLTPQNTLKFSKEVTLGTGINYFWVAADIKSSALDGHVLDAGLINVVLNGQIQAPQNQNPKGRRLIKNAQEITEMPYVSIIPKPNSYVAGTGKFTINAQTKILVTAAAQEEGEFLASFLKNATGFTLPVSAYSGSAVSNSIALNVDAASAMEDEEYSLVSTSNNIVISAKKGVGAFWGIQTLRQLLPVKIESKTSIPDYSWTVPAAIITDKPRFEYRGVMLDPARHFFSVEFTKKYIDLLSLYKINVFHWHLTEDQGWRIEIKRYPKLQEIGAWRECGTGLYGSPDGSRYGGYYTQEEIKDVVAYAAERHIEIIPEIEIPGHSLAIIASYPELACTSGPGNYKVMCSGGISTDIICGGNDSTLAVFKHIFDEVMELFPSKYVHVGGDEAPKTRWQTCTKCQAKITELGFVNQPNSTKEEKLQRYIIDSIGSYLMSKGKEYIGWTEIANSGVMPKGAILQEWQGKDELAVQQGHKVIRSSYYNAMYIAQRQSGDASEPSGPSAITTLEQTYGFDPIRASYTTEQEKLVLGLEACLWTEHVVTGSHAEYMTNPRMQATAEIGWSKKVDKDINTFKRNMLPHYMRLDEMDQNYRRHDVNALSNLMVKKIINSPTVIESTVEGLSYFWNDTDFSTTKSITVSESGTYKCYVNSYGVQTVVIYEVTYSNVIPELNVHSMPKVSDGANEYWYYMKVQGDEVNTSRTAKVLTKNAAKYYFGVDAWNNKSDWTQFKIVAGTASGKYQIVTKDDLLYLNKGINGNFESVNVFSTVKTSAADWTFIATTDTRGVVAYSLKNISNQYLLMKTGGANGFALRTDYASEEDNSRWNFIPADEPGFQVSDGTTNYWYTIKNLDPLTTSSKHKAGLKVNTDDNKLLVSQAESELWRFVAGATSGKYYIVNENGQYITRTLSGVNYTTVTTPNETCEFEIYPTVGIHSSKKDFIFANNFVAGTPVSMLSPADASPFNLINKTTFDQASKWLVSPIAGQLEGHIALAVARLAATTEGSRFGQFPTATRTALSDAITAAQGANIGTVENYNNAIAAISGALAVYNTKMLTSYSSLLSVTPNYYSWYKFKNKAYPTKVITANTVTENGTLICQVVGTKADAELWRFEVNAEDTRVQIISKSQPTLGIQENGKSTAAKLVSLDKISEFLILPQGAYWSFQQAGGGQFNYLHCDGSSNIVGWETTDPSQWTLEFNSETAIVPSALNLNKEVKYMAYGQMGKIHISSPSAEQLDIAVYSITGQNLYNLSTNLQTVVTDKTFAAGVYLVRINQSVTKVIVR